MANLSRRDFLAIASGLSLAPLLPGCMLHAQPLAIAAGIWPGYEPLFLAQRQGWLDKDLIHLTAVPSNKNSLVALVSGQVQGAALTLDEVLSVRAGGLPLTIVLVLDISAGGDMLLARKPITSLAGLKHKRIGVEQGTNASLLLSEALLKADLSTSDVTQINLSVGDHPKAWARGEIDAVITYVPSSTLLLDKGAVRLFDSRDIPNRIVDVLALRSDSLTPENAASIRHLVKAHFRALDFLSQQPQDAAQLMANHLNMKPEQVLPSYAGIHLPGVAENRQLLDGAFPGLLNSAHMISAFMTTAKLLPKEASLSELISAAYLPHGK